MMRISYEENFVFKGQNEFYQKTLNARIYNLNPLRKLHGFYQQAQ